MSWTAYSPEAVKAMQAADSRRLLWSMRLSCRLARTSNSAVLMWPDCGGARHRDTVRRWIAKRLPMFTFDSRRNYWTAPLAAIADAAPLLPEANISSGARQWLQEQAVARC